MLRPALLVAAVILAPAAALASQSRFVGDAQDVRWEGIAACPDGGAALVGNPSAWPPGPGLLLRTDASDAVAWALRTPGKSLLSVAALPDDSVLAGANEWLARIDAAGAVTWQAAMTGTSVRSISCRGWECVLAGSGGRGGVVVRFDGASGTVAWSEVFPDPGFEPMRVILLSDGEVGVAASTYRGSLLSTALARLDRDGGPRWCVQTSDLTWDGNYDVLPTPMALVELPGDRMVVAVVANYGETQGGAVSPDGLEIALLSTRSVVPTSAVLRADGDLVLSCRSDRLETFDSSLRLLDAVTVLPPASGHAAQLALSTGGSLLAASTRLLRLAPALPGGGPCPSLARSSLGGQAGGPPVLRTTPWPLAPPERDAVVPSTALAGVEPACAFAACLAPCEADCADGIDDDADGAADCADRACAFDPGCASSDTDGDGEPNASDCRPDDPTALALPAPIELRVRMRTWGRFRYPELTGLAADGSLADVARGRLADLLADRATARATCAVRRSATGGLQPRDVGDTWWLARAVNSCGVGSWDEPGLDSASPCP